MKAKKETLPVVNELPPAFVAGLKVAGLSEFFAGCTPAHRQEYLRWIGEAKREETRKARIEKTLTMLAEKHIEESARAKKQR